MKHRMYRNHGKRLLDIVFSTMMIVLLAPLLIVIGIAVRLDSKGPAVFTQDRYTLNGRIFKMLKFRTMIEHAEQLGTGAYSFDDDPRVTRVGRILRKTSLDELLQLINILYGDMSFVGPRPILTYHPCKYEEYNEDEKKIFSVRPGITGWAQVNGRNSLDWIRRFELNEWYADHVSFWLDMRIIGRTFKQVFSSKETVIHTETAKAFIERKKETREGL